MCVGGCDLPCTITVYCMESVSRPCLRRCTTVCSILNENAKVELFGVLFFKSKQPLFAPRVSYDI